MNGERVDGEKDGRLRSETLGHEEGTEKRRNWQRSDHGAGGQWRERGVWENVAVKSIPFLFLVS